ncbi:hypothetical protein ACKFKF_28635 [Phormidesmis sp. 146-12]
MQIPQGSPSNIALSAIALRFPKTINPNAIAPHALKERSHPAILADLQADISRRSHL